MPVVVQRIGPGEGAVLRDIRLRALRDAPSAFGSTFEAEVALPDAHWDDRAARGAAGPGSATFLAREGGEIVGVVSGYRDGSGSAAVELVSMWVAPQVRRKGAATALVQAVIDWAAPTAAGGVDLWVTSGNASAIALYAGLGFEETGDAQPLPSDPCKDELRMTRRL